MDVWDPHCDDPVCSVADVLEGDQTAPWWDVTNSFLYRHTRRAGAGHVLAMQLAMNGEADIPAGY